ncbi:MAG: transcription initiation factor IIB [Candidatus Heimdallarchaeaceae archaeon]
MPPRSINLSNTIESSLPRCPDCNSTKLNFDSQRGETSCSNCGLVIEEAHIDSTHEWRAYNQEQYKRRARTGSPKNLLSYDNYGSVISYSNKDIYGNKISPKKASQMFRLRTLQRRAVFQYGTERNLLFALSEIKRIGSQLNLPQKIQETGSIVYRKILKTGLIRGRSTEALVSASVYLACRLHHQPETLEDVAKKTRLSRKKLARNFRLLLKNLDIKTPLANPEIKLEKYGNMMKFPPKVINEAKEILIKAKEAKITVGKNPNSLVAAALYISAIKNGIHCAQKDISRACQITEVTLRNRYKEFLKALGIRITIK